MKLSEITTEERLHEYSDYLVSLEEQGVITYEENYTLYNKAFFQVYKKTADEVNLEAEKDKIHVVVVVKSGLVEYAYSKNENVTIEVIDLDLKDSDFVSSSDLELQDLRLNEVKRLYKKINFF